MRFLVLCILNKCKLILPVVHCDHREVIWKMAETLREWRILGGNTTKVARVGERSICDNFTKFNSRTVNGPFLSDTGINQEVSGGR